MRPLRFASCLFLFLVAGILPAQNPPYDVFPAAESPYYRVRYEASTESGELKFPVSYTIWIPENVDRIRGIVVHQHGCGEGSCKSGLTGAFDLHWQALAKKHDCALLAPSYEQPQEANCQLWCDPRNGSAKAFLRGLEDLGRLSGHRELAEVPWALWGHSGGGHWVGGMTLLYPERVAAVWHRSGVPLMEPNPDRPEIKPYPLPEAALSVPMMCNPGTKEGVTVKEGRFAGVWPANEAFFEAVRSRGGRIAIDVDPLSSHECGNQRYLAIPWLDACLTERLSHSSNELNELPQSDVWLAPITGGSATRVGQFDGDPLAAGWLHSEEVARRWMEYVNDTNVVDVTPPPAPTSLRREGGKLTWTADADLQSGLAYFIIQRDGKEIAKVPEDPKNRFGRPLFQDLQYSDTPVQPLMQMTYVDTQASPDATHQYHVIAVNTVGLRSQATAPVPH